VRWWEYLSCYDYDLIHVDGVDNKVADCLSCYCENDGPDDSHLDHEFVTTDTCLNPEGELQPINQYIKMQTAAARRSKHLQECVKQRVLDNNTMNAGQPAFGGTSW
jgi:hypothetical protein